MPQLHEVLAVDKDQEQISSKVLGEAVVTFSKKTDHFTGHVRTLTMFDAARKNEEQSQQEVKEITTTVPEKLLYVAQHFIRYYDVLAQKEATNQHARADVILPDGSTLLESVPATLLLGLENKLAKLREMYDAIPTLQPGVEWEADPSARLKGVYKAKTPEYGQKTEKDFQHRILVAATDKHPAQIEKWNIDKVVGEYKRDRVSGMLTPAQKSSLLARLDSLIGAVKQARMRANIQEVVKMEMGKKIFDYLHQGLY